MPNYPAATLKRVFEIDGLKGHYQRITQADANLSGEVAVLARGGAGARLSMYVPFSCAKEEKA
jgi:hypothetical protein